MSMALLTNIDFSDAFESAVEEKMIAEQKQLNCMILENCCYDWFEMRTLNMAQHGVFGEILRAQGAYIHNLDDFWDYYWKNPDGSDPDQLGYARRICRGARSADLCRAFPLEPAEIRGAGLIRNV